MKTIHLVLVLLLVTLFLASCKDEEITLEEKIRGTWVGVERPETDTVFFYYNNAIRISTYGYGVGDTLDYDLVEGYTLHEGEIYLFLHNQSTFLGGSKYEFRNNGNEIYITNLLPYGTSDGDGGILFRKF